MPRATDIALLDKAEQPTLAWIEKNRLRPSGVSYECYFNGPPFPMDEMLTMVVMPLE